MNHLSSNITFLVELPRRSKLQKENKSVTYCPQNLKSIMDGTNKVLWMGQILTSKYYIKEIHKYAHHFGFIMIPWMHGRAKVGLRLAFMNV